MSTSKDPETTATPPTLPMADWVSAVDQNDALKPHRQHPVEDWSRRRLGILICVVALLYPLYAYAVQRYLLEAEMTAAIRELNEEMRSWKPPEIPVRRASLPRGSAPKPPRPQVVGVIDGQQPTVIAKLSGRSPSEITPTLCAQAEQWLKRDLADQHIRIQEDRGTQPAQNAGVIWCD